MPRTVHVVLNPMAGGLSEESGEGLAEDIRERLRTEGCADPSVELVDPVDTPRRIQAARQAGVDLVIVGGGDGTIAAAAAGLLGSRTALGILPLGTANMLARDVGIPVEDSRTTLDRLLAGAPRPIDVGTVHDHLFLINAVVGRLSSTAQLRERGRDREGPALWLSLLRAGARAWRDYPEIEVAVSIDDGAPMTLRTPLLMVGVNALSGRTSWPFGREVFDRGELVLYAVPPRDQGGGLMETLAAIAQDADGYLARSELGRGRSITLSGGRAALTTILDGEPQLLDLPMTLAVRPSALLLQLPASA